MSGPRFFGITSHPKFRRNTKCEPLKTLVLEVHITGSRQ